MENLYRGRFTENTGRSDLLGRETAGGISTNKIGGIRLPLSMKTGKDRKPSESHNTLKRNINPNSRNCLKSVGIENRLKKSGRKESRQREYMPNS